MTHDEFLNLKSGDLIEHTGEIYWFKSGWDKSYKLLFVILSFKVWGFPRADDLDGTLICDAPKSHDFQCRLLYEGRIVNLTLCPHSIRLLSRDS